MAVCLALWLVPNLLFLLDPVDERAAVDPAAGGSFDLPADPLTLGERTRPINLLLLPAYLAAWLLCATPIGLLFYAVYLGRVGQAPPSAFVVTSEAALFPIGISAMGLGMLWAIIPTDFL